MVIFLLSAQIKGCFARNGVQFVNMGQFWVVPNSCSRANSRHFDQLLISASFFFINGASSSVKRR